MNMNFLGKGLVLLHTAFSLLALAFAAGLFLQFVDWGWKEPRKDLEQRRASEIDKRIAALKLAVQARDLTLPDLKTTQAAARDAQARFGPNHLHYRQQLAMLEKGAGTIDARSIVFADGSPVLETGKVKSGKPAYDPKMPAGIVLEGKPIPIEKSYEAYLEDLRYLMGEVDDKGAVVRKGEIDKFVDDTRVWLEKAKMLTFFLNGKDDTGKDIKPGLYKLLEEEYQAQVAAKFERSYLQPIWAATSERAELFMERRLRLEQTLDRLRKDRGAPSPK